MPTIHDRTPVILDKTDFNPWLSGAADEELLRPAADDHLRMWPVSRRVNKTGSGDNGPTPGGAIFEREYEGAPPPSPT
jgi:putative SOS response-associated peptidase YedK